MRASWYRRIRRFNSWVIAIFGVVAILAAIVAVGVMVSFHLAHRPAEDGLRPVEATPVAYRFGGEERVVGTPFLAMTVVGGGMADASYSSKSTTDDRNILLLNLQNGQSRYILPNNDRPMVQWHVLSLDDGKEALAYVALVGDDRSSRYDVLIGSFATNRQKWVARSVEAMDVPTMVDRDTLGMILWRDGRARYQLYGLPDLGETLSTPIPALAVVEGR